MCWESKTKELRISDGNVKIIKVGFLRSDLGNNIVSAYFYNSFVYDLGQEYKTEMKIHESFEWFRGYNGFHSFSADKCKAESRINGQLSIYAVLNGKEEWINGFGTAGRYPTVVVEGYIPEGATYCINEKEEIISDSIVLTKIKEVKICAGHQQT